MIGLLQRASDRHHDATFETFGDPTRPLANLAADYISLSEIRTRCIQDERLPAGQLMSRILESRAYHRSAQTSGVVGGVALVGIKVDVEVLALQHFPGECVVVDFVPAELVL